MTTKTKPGDGLTGEQLGMPWRVELETADYIYRAAYATEQDAEDARDRAYMGGFTQVRIRAN